MARVSFREVRERFTHIDAEFVSCCCSFNEGQSRYVVRLYPWWEHPAYIAAIKEGRPWGFTNTLDGAKEITVFPIEPVAFKLSLTNHVIDWTFLEEHPILWQFQDREQIFCNRDVRFDDLVGALLARKHPYVSRGVLYDYLDPIPRWKAPYSLGSFPTTLFRMVREELERLGVPLFIPREPEDRPTPALLLIDGEDYIVAQDFELEVPEFQHPLEYFKPFERQ